MKLACNILTYCFLQFDFSTTTNRSIIIMDFQLNIKNISMDIHLKVTHEVTSKSTMKLTFYQIGEEQEVINIEILICSIG